MKPPHEFISVGEGNKKYCYHPDLVGQIFKWKKGKYNRTDVAKVPTPPQNVVQWYYKTILTMDPPEAYTNSNTKHRFNTHVIKC